MYYWANFFFFAILAFPTGFLGMMHLLLSLDCRRFVGKRGLLEACVPATMAGAVFGAISAALLPLHDLFLALWASYLFADTVLLAGLWLLYREKKIGK